MAKIVQLSKVMQNLNNDVGFSITEVEKVKVLKSVNNFVRLLLHLHYDPNIIWDLPKGAPGFKSLIHPEVENSGVLYYLLNKRHFKYFIKGNYDDLDVARRQGIYIDMLKAVHQDDAKMLISIKERENIWPNISYDLVKRAFSPMTDNWSVKSPLKNKSQNKKEELTEPVSNGTLSNVLVLNTNNASELIGLDYESVREVFDNVKLRESEEISKTEMPLPKYLKKSVSKKGKKK